MNIEKSYDILQALWPIAIVQDRYMGTYTGGQWIAIPQADLAPSLEKTVWGDDGDCSEWAASNVETVGVGNTPQEAYENLLSLPQYQRPEERVKNLEEAIKRHRDTVIASPERTAEAEDELWGLIE